MNQKFLGSVSKLAIACALVSTMTPVTGVVAEESTAALVNVSKEETSKSVKLTKTEFCFTYNAKEDGFDNLLSGTSNPKFYVYAGNMDESTAAELLAELQMVPTLQKNSGTVNLINPIDGKDYTDADLQQFITLLGGAVSNAKVIGVKDGADFVLNTISQNSYAVAGIFVDGGELKEGLSLDYAVPAYLNNATQETVDYFVAANEAEKVDDHTFENKEFTTQRVVTGEEETLADAFANAWTSVFSKNYRQDNLDTEFYMTTAETHTHPYELIEIADFEELGITYKPHFSEPLNGEGEYTWFEYIPSTFEQAADGTVPLVISLHGNGNDARLQAETTGWAELSAKEGFLLECPEWQDIVLDSETHEPGPNAFNCDGLEREKLIEWIEMLKTEYPQIDASRIYITGLSAGASASTLYAVLYPNYFAGVAAVSGPGVDKDELTKLMETYEGEEMPYLYVCGDHDFFGMIPVDGSSKNSLQVGPDMYIQDVDANCAMFPFIQAYQKVNGLDVSETYDMSLNAYYGVSLENEQEIKLGYKDAVEGTLSNANGPIVKLTAIKDQAHWNYKYEAEYIWEFWKEFSRDTESGKLVRGSAPAAEAQSETSNSKTGYLVGGAAVVLVALFALLKNKKK